MQKKFKKLMSLLLILSILSTFARSVAIFADENEISPEIVLSLKNNDDLIKFYSNIKYMSENDLQKVINYAKFNSENKNPKDILRLKAAWLAAAQVARLKGYPLSATLVEHSVWNKDYKETNGQFASAIKLTKVYHIMVKEVKGTDAFETSDSSDLYYSLHGFSYSGSVSSQGMRIWITDVYDFSLKDSYSGNLFANLVNNWGYLSQWKGVLEPIKIEIVLDV